MKNQQQAEKEEQQRIKNLVLNYDLQQNEDQESISARLTDLPEETKLVLTRP